MPDIITSPSIRSELTGLYAGRLSSASPRIDGGKAPFRYSLSGDAGLSVSLQGRIFGTPSGAPITFTVLDALDQQASRTFTPESANSAPRTRAFITSGAGFITTNGGNDRLVVRT